MSDSLICHGKIVVLSEVFLAAATDNLDNS